MAQQRLTTDQAARVLGVSVDAVRKRAERGRLPHEKEGNSVVVVNSTFSGNGAEFVGGGIQNANAPAARLRMGNTVFADNARGNVNNVCAGGQCRGTITDGGYNISDDRSFRFSSPTSKTDVNPRLEPGGPQNNGGPTDAIALQGSFPAVEAVPKGVNGCGTVVKRDQRGVQRPQGKRCDAGAFENQVGPR